MKAKIAKKTIFSALKRYAEKALTGKPLELLTISDGESTDAETGTIVPYIRLEVEVPRNSGEFSRCRFSVKVPNGKKLIENDALNTTDYLVVFKCIEISYIDDHENVYFRAEDYTLKKEG